jgi:hypothetical protein
MTKYRITDTACCTDLMLKPNRHSIASARAVQGHNIRCQGRSLSRGTDDEGVCVLVVTDRFIHE